MFFFKLFWLISIIFVTYLSLAAQVELPFKVKNVDKFYHALAYLWLAVLPFIGFQRLNVALLGAFFMIPFGIGLEYAQAFFASGRFFSPADMAADTIGVVLGMAVGGFLRFRYIRT